MKFYQLGNIVFDVEVKPVGDNMKVMNNRLAIKEGKNDTTFLDIEAWNSNAEFIDKHYKKGFEILALGHLKNKNIKKDNIDFQTVVFVIDEVKFTHGNPRELDVPDFL